MKYIIEQGRRVEKEEFARTFTYKDDPHAGKQFDCDKDGKLEPMTPSQKQAWEWVMEHLELFNDKGVVRFAWTYWQPAKIHCHCGDEFYLPDSLENECDNCGRLYNGFGQELAPREQWEERWDEDDPYPMTYNQKHGINED